MSSPTPTGSPARTFRSRITAGLLATTAILGVDAVTTIAPAAAQGTTSRVSASRSFDIPAQPLATALNSFGRQSGLQVSLAASTTQGVISRAVTGSYTPDQALAQMLAGTGISYRLTGNGTAVVGAQPTAAGGTLAADGTTVLDTISVTGGGGGSGIGEGGVGEINVTTQDLERKNPTDIAGVFRGETGISVGSSLPMSQKVYVHGLEETNLAVTVDGSRQNNKVFHHNGTNLIDPGLLKAVGVDAGIAPADAGPGALAGSIRYETKDVGDLLPGEGVGGFINSTFNTNSQAFNTGLAAYGKTGGLEALGYFNFGLGGEFTAGNGQEIAGTETDILSGMGKLAYEFDSGDRVEISHERLRDAAPRPFRANIGFIAGRPPWEPRVRDYTLDRQNTVFTYTDVTPEGWWDPTLLLAYSKSEVGTLAYLRPVAPAVIPETYPVSGDTGSFNGKFENKFSFDIGNIIAGVDFYSDEASLNDPFDEAREKADNVGIYAQARLTPFERTRLSFGLRGDRQSFTGTTDQSFDNTGLSGNISGEYDLIEDLLTAKAGYSHVWAGISLAENFVMNPNWDYGTGPEPVTADNYTVGLVARHQGFSLEGNVFRTTIDDARASRYAIASAALQRDLVSEGFDIAAGYDWGDGFFSIKYADIDVTIDGLPADSDTGTYLAAPAGQFITLAAAHTFADRGITIGGDIEIALENDDVLAGSPPYESYEVVSTYVEYVPPSRPNLKFRAEVNNLFDQTYADRATYGQEFGTVTPLYEPGRSFILSARASF